MHSERRFEQLGLWMYNHNACLYLDLDGSWLREWESLPPGLDEGSPHEHPGLDEGSPHDHASADREHMLQKRMSGALMVPWPQP